MAELDFENDLKAMFVRADPAFDAPAFAARADRRIRKAGLGWLAVRPFTSEN